MLRAGEAPGIRAVDPKQPKYASGVLLTELSSYFVPYMRSPASPKPGTM